MQSNYQFFSDHPKNKGLYKLHPLEWSALCFFDIKEYLEQFEITSCTSKRIDFSNKNGGEIIRYKLDVNGYNNLKKWFMFIGSSNQRNLIKYNEAMKLFNQRTKV